MKVSEQINIELKINSVRLELIKIIADINRTLSSNPKAISSLDYKSLKSEYELKKEEIFYLQTAKKTLTVNQRAA